MSDNIEFIYNESVRDLVFTGEITVEPGEGLPEDIEKNYYLEKINYYQNYQKSLTSDKSRVGLFSTKSTHFKEEIKNAQDGLKNMGFNSDGNPITKSPESSVAPGFRLKKKRVAPAPVATPPSGDPDKCVSKSKISYKDVVLKYSPILNQTEVIFDEDTLNIKFESGAKSLPLIKFFNYKSDTQEYDKGKFKSKISVKDKNNEYAYPKDGSNGLPVELILANLIYYLSKKLSPGSEKFNIHVESTSKPELGDYFSGQTSYYKSLGFTNTTEARDAAESKAVTWTGFTQEDIIERIDAIFTSKLKDTDKEDIKSLVTDGNIKGGGRKNKRGSKKGKKINGSPRKRKRSNKKPKKKINKNH